MEFVAQEFTPANTNGYIYDHALDHYWYMVNLPTGFLPGGVYSIEVLGVDGEILTRSRHHDIAASRSSVEFYTSHRSEIAKSFTPSGRTELETMPGDGELEC